MNKILILCLVMISALYSEADINIKSAENAYFNKEYKKAFSMFQYLADKGIVEANHFLGTLYYLGRGVNQDYKKAFSFYTIAANKGIIESKSNLALMYQEGQGVKKDNQKSFLLFKEVADKSNNGIAQNNVGYAYSIGQGIKKDYKKALYYYKKACNNQAYESCHYAGTYYENGVSVDKNITMSKQYYRQACDAGINDACKDMNKLIESKSIFATIAEQMPYYILFAIMLAVMFRRDRKKKNKEL